MNPRRSLLQRLKLLLIGLALSAPLADAPSALAQQCAPPVRDSERIFRQQMLSWKDLKQQNVVMQKNDYSCGAAALATVMKFYWGDEVTELQLLTIVEKMLKPAEVKDRILHGLTLTDLKKVAAKMKYDATMGRLSLAELAEAKVPVIVAIKVNGYDHFVAVRGIYDDMVYLADPIRGNLRLPINVFSEQWIDSALLVIAKPNKTSSDLSRIDVTQAEVEFPWLNRQLIRTRSEKTYQHPLP